MYACRIDHAAKALKPDNQFTFDGAVFSVSTENVPFSIGNFSYRNGSTYNSTGINGVNLTVSMGLTAPTSLSNNYDFGFSIINTPNNTGDPVLDGDIVNVTSGYSSTVFSYLGTTYTLQLLGFSSDGGNTIRTDFSSPEGATAYAQLFARFTSDIPHSVPEPVTTGLMALSMGVLGLVGIRKRQR
jgi:hypothetical protein